MTEAEATAEVFWTAFKVLLKAEQQAVLRRLVQDQKLRRYLLDLSLIEERRGELARPLEECLNKTENNLDNYYYL